MIAETRRRWVEANPNFWEIHDPIFYARGKQPDFDFDERRPEVLAAAYKLVENDRIDRLARLRSDPRLLAYLKEYYAQHPSDFISDWGSTFDPRNPDISLPSTVPFLLFQRQKDWVEYILDRWQARERGLTEKSRDSGVSWLAIALSCTLCLFNKGLVIGFGSRVEEYVDKIGEPKSLFEKARMFLRGIPPEFLDGWDVRRHAFHMRIAFPGTGSFLTGEGGANIGRGNRTTLYFVDEAAHLEQPMLAEASLSNTTNCRQDISTPKGLGNPFEQNRHSGRINVFTFHWRDDPRKDETWYQKQIAEAHSPAIVAQEVDIDYAASVEGVLIPNAWVMSSIDAHLRLGIEPTGRRVAGLDVADEGADRNALCGGQGILIDLLDEWSGKGDDIFTTVERAFRLCNARGVFDLHYDADGLGAGVRGDARVLNERRSIGDVLVNVVAFRGSAKPYNPEQQDVKGRKNKDFFANMKAQAWWSLRHRFLCTYRWITENMPCHSDEIISISSNLPDDLRSKLTSELSQPTYHLNTIGKMLVDKSPPGSRSPNLADALMIRFARVAEPVQIGSAALAKARQIGTYTPRVWTTQRPQQEEFVAPLDGAGIRISAAAMARAREFRR